MINVREQWVLSERCGSAMGGNGGHRLLGVGLNDIDGRERDARVFGRYVGEDAVNLAQSSGVVTLEICREQVSVHALPAGLRAGLIVAVDVEELGVRHSDILHARGSEGEEWSSILLQSRLISGIDHPQVNNGLE